MSSFGIYKNHKLKNTTPITWFHCSYCGKYQWRRTSKIKNPNLIFCDNICRAKFASNLSIRFVIRNKDIQPYLFKFKNENIKLSSAPKSVLGILDKLKIKYNIGDK